MATHQSCNPKIMTNQGEGLIENSFIENATTHCLLVRSFLCMS